MDIFKTNFTLFAEEGADGGAGTPDDGTDVAEGEGDNNKEPDNNSEEKTFTQAELDEIIKNRLAQEKRTREREIEKAREAEEKKRLEENDEFKELYDKAQAKLAEYDAREAQRERQETIVSKLKEHGFSDEQATKHAERVSKFVSDDTMDDEIREYADDFKTANTVDPSAGFGRSKKAEPQSDEEYGQNMLDRVRGLTKTQYK